MPPEKLEQNTSSLNTESEQNLFVDCMHEARVFAFGAVKGAIQYAEKNQTLAFADTALGIGLGLASRECPEFAGIVAMSTAGAIISAELGKNPDTNLGQIFKSAWNARDEKSLTQLTEKVADATGGIVFNAFAITACAMLTKSYGNHLSDTTKIEVGISPYGSRQTMLKSLDQLRTGAGHLSLRSQKNLTMEWPPRPAPGDLLKDVTGRFDGANINEFLTTTKRRQYWLEPTLTTFPIRQEIPR